MSTEPRSISVLFAAICGTSRLQEKLGEAEATRAVERCLHRVERGVEGFKGRIVKTAGDELVVLFDSAEEAAHAAGEIQARVKALPPVSGINLAIRIGFHHGEVAGEGDDLSGEAVIVAMRLAALAAEGQVFTSAQTAALLSADIRDRVRTIELDGGAQEVGEVVELSLAGGANESTMQFSAQAPAPKETWLHLRCGTQEVWVASSKPAATLGRDPNSDLMTRDSRASRHHGRIERRRDKFVLIDESTNGTYVKYQGEPEFFLRHQDAVLRGRGRISFGHSTEDGDDETVEFEVIG